MGTKDKRHTIHVLHFTREDIANAKATLGHAGNRAEAIMLACADAVDTVLGGGAVISKEEWKELEPHIEPGTARRAR